MSKTISRTARSNYNVDGTKLYQTRAKIVLPILVRQAKTQQPIFYGDLAAEAKMPNARNLNYVLGAIGSDLNVLGKHWKVKVPPLQALVVNRAKGVPGDGFYGFLNVGNFNSLGKSKQRHLMRAVLNEIFMFPRWDDVLSALNLKQSAPVDPALLERTRKIHGGSGESAEHKALKHLIYDNPSLVGIEKVLECEMEFPFESADRLDVLFKTKSSWYGVEIKPKAASPEEITRGMFQVVKYRALIEAHQKVRGLEPNADVLLALGGTFPSVLESLKNVLGITIFDNLQKVP